MLLLVALKTIYQKVQAETQLFVNPDNKQNTAIEIILNTDQIRIHTVTIILMALSLLINFVTSLILKSKPNN